MYQRRAQEFSQALTSLLAEAASEESVFVDVTPFSQELREPKPYLHRIMVAGIHLDRTPSRY